MCRLFGWILEIHWKSVAGKFVGGELGKINEDGGLVNLVDNTVKGLKAGRYILISWKV